MKSPIRFLRAGATGQVFAMRRGKPVDKGVGARCLVLPGSLFAIVPTTPQILPFAVEALTADLQSAQVRGSVTISLVPSVAVGRFDFTVDASSGGFLGDWSQQLAATINEYVVRAVLARIKICPIASSLSDQAGVEAGITKALATEALANLGIVLVSCSVVQIVPVNRDVKDALGAKERQELLTAADNAASDRRQNAAERERAIKEYEAGTALTLEQARTALIEAQAANRRTEAEADAAATKIRLAPLQELQPGVVIGAALLRAAEAGTLGSFVITTELLTALQQTK